MPRYDMTRRDFLRATTGAAGLLLLNGRSFAIPASEKVVVAHIGLGGMGNSHLHWFTGMPDVDVAALCDVDQARLADAVKLVRELRPDCHPQTYTDFRRVLDRQDIDVVTYATPDHWHALMACMAFQAGKDVYGEKPLSYSVTEGQAMLRTMKRHGRIFQLGTQIHAGDNYHRVVEIVRSGILGKIRSVHLWKTGGSPSLGYPNPEPVPPTLDWDLWLGPAPFTPYIPAKCHFNFRYFLDYSGGMFQDFWCHIADILFWSMHPKKLKSVSARGEQPKESIADAPSWIEAEFEFEDLHVRWTQEPPPVPGAGGRGIGAYFQGSEGSLLCDYENKLITLGSKTYREIPEIPKTIPRSPGHQRNFLDCVKSREQPESNLPYVREMTLPMNLAIISYRLGRKLRWDSHHERFHGDDAANRLLSRPFRGEWRLP